MVILTPEFLFKFTKYSVAFLCFWPPYKNCPANEIIKFNIKWCLMLIISSVATVFTCYSLYKTPIHDILMFIYFIGAIVVCIQIPLKMIVSKFQWDKFQFLFEEMENYVSMAQSDERLIFLHYANQYGFVHIGYTVLIYLAAISTIMGPIVTMQSLPSDVEYPFSVDKHPVLDFMYCLQSVQMFQCSSSFAVDCQMAVLLWYIAVRFKILGIHVKSVKNAYEFGCWIEKHQNLLRHTEKVIVICKSLNVITVVSIIIPIVLGGIIIQLEAPLVLKIQMMSFIGSLTMQLFISAWPSEILRRTYENIAWDVYDSNYSKNYFDQRVIFVIQRTQLPPAIAIPGIFPAMSLTFYSQFLSRTFSYFTTVRVLISQMNM